MQPHEEQPQVPPLDQPTPSPYAEVPAPSNQPLVTLSPEEMPVTQVAEPANLPDEPVSEVGAASNEPVRWQATEYVHRERDRVWFTLFVVATLVFIAAAIFLIKSATFAILIPVMAAALVVYTKRPPQVLDYTLSRQGLHINDRLYPFSEFKSFALVHGGDQYFIMLIPTKRFKPGVAIYFPQEAGEAIVDMLAARLPMQEMQLDVVDRLIQKLHL